MEKRKKKEITTIGFIHFKSNLFFSFNDKKQSKKENVVFENLEAFMIQTVAAL